MGPGGAQIKCVAVRLRFGDVVAAYVAARAGRDALRSAVEDAGFDASF